jgi:hypothetical protein
MPTPHVKCPTCGSEKVALIQAADSSAAPKNGDGAPEAVVHYAFQCECGVGFTHTVKREATKSATKSA